MTFTTSPYDDEESHILRSSPPLAGEDGNIKQTENNCCITTGFLLHVILIVLLFTLPRAIANNSDADGFTQLANGIAIVFVIGLLMIILSIVNSVVSCRNWSTLSTSQRFMGMFPLVSTIIVIVVIGILVKIENDKNGGSDNEPVCPDGEDCPTPKTDDGS